MVRITVLSEGIGPVDEADVRARARGRLGPFGVWLAPHAVRATPVAVLRAQARRIEELGYGSLWTGEPPVGAPVAGREIFSLLAVLLAATDRLVLGAGVANVTMRRPQAVWSAASGLDEGYPGRLVLGLGGADGPRPLRRLRGYLDAMDAQRPTDEEGGALPAPFPLVLAAIGPRAQALAVERADGVHPFLQPVAHTARARRAIGEGPLLIPHQALTLEEDPELARGRLRAVLGAAGGRPLVENAYTRNYRRLGYGDRDLAGGGADALVDAVLAHGGAAAVAGRLRAQLEAGADHVLLHPLTDDLPSAVDDLARLAPFLAE
ncbi:LLM class flavin-dependent oxidoreductase [Streptomyces profundus]|uniref:LLM class flavin-dependent oxidoreductase n=1 Tax=Streptomyces profundus TaxID=2867410 RepID=UPI001D15F6C1|nr:LLM class flavin-dependent oxidoreductase [Streptomyces sp. MA3_2.13]UED86493.1 LLM class flavin-dependent oxidoreductase [Streptomyces sp. MA3_2.13]